MRAAVMLGACAALLSGCATPLDAPLSPTFGVAVATLATQALPPAAQADGPPVGSGARGARAIARYERGEPKPLETPNASAGMAMGPLSPEGVR